MPAPYKNAETILADAIADGIDPTDYVLALAERHAWDIAHTIETHHAVRRLEVRRDAFIQAAQWADEIGRGLEVDQDDDRDTMSDQDPDILGHLEDAIQVDHLTDAQADEVLAILERAGY